jgi:LysM repeat protein
LLETEGGNSDLLKKSNNHFGIKCKDTWTAGGVSHDDDAKGECFRSYKNAEESYRDHSNFLRGSDRYSWLFQLNPLDYKGWAYGLKKSGYATNPAYPQILINNIEQYNLQQYSLVAVNDVPKIEPAKYKDDPEVTDDTNQQDAEYAKTDLNSTGTINGCKYIFATSGTSLLAIATNNNIDLSKLLDFNDLTQDGILAKDQIIFLQKKSKEGDKDFCIMQDNQSLYDVAQKNGIQLQSLLDYNQLTSATKVYPGTKLYLKQQVKDVAQTTSSNQNRTSKKYYNVGPKEGLYSISKKFSVSIEQLKEWNNLTSDSLHIGQELVIYQ